MTAINTTKARVLSCNIKGVECRGLVRKISIRESVCSPYLQGEILLVDPFDMISGNEVSAGDPVNISFDAPVNAKVYNCQMYILNIKGKESPDNLRAIIYQIAIVGSEYYSDRENLVQMAEKQMTGASMVQKIWGQLFDSSLSIPVQDTLFSDGNESAKIHNVKPFTAIRQIREKMNFPSYKTGNTLLFRDAMKENLVPLEYLFDTLSAQQTFIQKATVGTSWRDMFESESIIISAIAHSRQSGGGGNSMAKQQGKKAFDLMQGKLGTNFNIAKQVSGIASAAASMQGGGIKSVLGGSPNIQLQNADRQTPASDYTQKTEAERFYVEMVKGLPQYSIKVPLQTGINITVGQGAMCKLLPPSGDINGVGSSGRGGLMLVTDLVHEVFNDQRQVQGTTSFQCIKDY